MLLLSKNRVLKVDILSLKSVNWMIHDIRLSSYPPNGQMTKHRSGSVYIESGADRPCFDVLHDRTTGELITAN